MDEEVEGFRVVAQALSKLGVKYMFGVVGIPVVEVENVILVDVNHCCSGGCDCSAGGCGVYRDEERAGSVLRSPGHGLPHWLASCVSGSLRSRSAALCRRSGQC